MSQPECQERSPGPSLVRFNERLQRWAFVAAIGLSAFLLFSLELRAGRLVLPVFGGAPAVWTTGLCFFTAVLFLGYVYAHLVPTRISLRAVGLVPLGLATVTRNVTYQASVAAATGAANSVWLVAGDTSAASRFQAIFWQQAPDGGSVLTDDYSDLTRWLKLSGF